MTKSNHSIVDLLKLLKQKRMLIVLLFGFSSGLPIMLLYSSVKIWLRREGIELSTIGYFSWITVPYSFNFIWAFLLDKYIPTNHGRRRSWIFICQIGLILTLFLLSFGDPHTSISFIVVASFLVCFFSATQDIAIDAYRREILHEDELGIGSSISTYGYRVGMLVASGLGLWVVDPETLNLSFNQMFLMMAGFMSIGLITTYFAIEPKMEGAPIDSFKEAIIEPFKEFLTRPYAVRILLFILFFKMGDAIAGSMLGPFYVDMGYTNKTIAEITKGIGFASSMAGLFVGGSVIYWLKYYKSLWIFGALQLCSTAFISTLVLRPGSKLALTQVVAFEDFSSGMGTAAMVAFMAHLTNKRFTATQYALFASLASFGRTFVSGFAGDLIEVFSYQNFFIACAVIAIPGLVLLRSIKKAC